MQEPLVTIVVISYNQGRYIKQNLDSIASQNYQNIELIVADDASSDDSVAIFDAWLIDNNYSAKKNYHRKNTGLATVLNECVALATGKYIKLIAADDYLQDESISKCVNKLEEVGEEYGMVTTDTFFIDDIGNVIADLANYNKSGSLPRLEFRERLLEANQIAALTVLIRLDVLRQTGEYKSDYIVEDYQRWLMINERYLIAYIPEKLSFYRVHGDNLSKKKAERINLEVKMLQMAFDHKGDLKKRINFFIQDNYVAQNRISDELLQAYSLYPYHNKTLLFFLKNNIPSVFFRMLYSLSIRMKFHLPLLICC